MIRGYGLKQPIHQGEISDSINLWRLLVDTRRCNCMVYSWLGGIDMKTAIREMYETAVRSAWVSFDDCEIQIYQNYTSALKLGALEPNDKTARDKNLALVQNWDSLSKRLNELLDSYQKTGDGGAKMKCLCFYTFKIASCDYVPRLEDGRLLKNAVHSRSIVKVYEDLAKYFEQYPDLGYRKYHRGARILIDSGSPLEAQLFVAPAVAPAPVVV